MGMVRWRRRAVVGWESGAVLMRVLSVIHYPVYGGPHNRNRRVAPLLTSTGMETVVLLPDEPGNAADRLIEGGLDVITIPLTRIRAKWNPLYHLRLFARLWGDVARIRQVIREREIDVVQINGLVNPQGAIAAKLERVPVVWQILDTYPPIWLRRLVMPLVKRLANVVMCTGLQVAAEHPGATDFKDNLVLFYPPVDLEQFTNSEERRELARRELALPEDTFVVGTVGNVNPQKGHLTFVRAAARLKKRISGVRFVILGATHSNHRALTVRILREAASLGLLDGVDISIVDPGAKVFQLEPAFDVFWMTSEPRSEGIPTAAEEAMALGIPVVGTEVGSLGEIVREGQTGFVVAPYDVDGLVERTMRLYNDRSLSIKLSEQAQADALSKFGVRRCADSHRQAYVRALNLAK